MDDMSEARIEGLTLIAREYLHRYGYLMSMMGDDVTEEVLAVERLINEIKGTDGVEVEP